MESISKILNRLFSRKVIYKRLPGRRLKLLDFNTIQQNYTLPTRANYQGIIRGGNIYNTFSNFNTPTPIEQVEATRKLCYSDYDLMDNDAIISSALDIYADEITISSETGDLINIITDDVDVKKVLYNLYNDVLNIEFNLWHWIRSLCKYGDLFLYIPSVDSVGIINAVPIHPGLIERDDYYGEDQNQTVFRFTETQTQISTGNDEDILKFHDIAHFRLLSDMNFLPYGKSLIEGSRKIFKQLNLMEDALLLSRIMRAPERRIFKIEVGNLAPEDVDAYIENIANSMKKTPYIDPQTGDYNLRFNLMNMMEDYFLPVRGGDSGTEIDSLPGLSTENHLEDVQYLQNKLFSNLKIPSAYLGYDEGIDGKGTLAAEDIRFARFVQKIQKVIVSELMKIGYVHLYKQGFISENKFVDFRIEMNSPSLIYERQKIDLMNEKVNLVSNLKDTNLFSSKYIYETIFNFSDSEQQQQINALYDDKLREYDLSQIENEGNDPRITGKSFGTAHDIAQLHVQSKLNADKGELDNLTKDDKRHDNPGRPEKQGSFEREKDDISGKDPTGRKSFQGKS